MDVALAAGAAHGHVGQFSAAAVGEHVGGIYRGALGAVHGDGVSVTDTIRPQVLAADM